MPGAGVRELQHGFVALALRGDFEQPAARFFQRVHRVFDDLDECLKELVGIAAHGGKIWPTDTCNSILPLAPRFHHLCGAVSSSAEIDEQFFLPAPAARS